MWPDSVAQSDALLTGDQESRVRCLPVQSGNSCLLHTIFPPETNTGYINISIMNYIECNDETHINECNICNNNNNNNY